MLYQPPSRPGDHPVWSGGQPLWVLVFAVAVVVAVWVPVLWWALVGTTPGID